MSTNDVPGANQSNNDTLSFGCWAEHKDGSLILVEGVETDRVIYSVFDFSQTPIMEYRDAMPKADFEEKFSFDGQKNSLKWTWHDKTPFPWNSIIKEGGRDGLRYACAEDQLNAAQKIASSRALSGCPLDPEKGKHLLPVTVPKMEANDIVQSKILKALSKLNKGLKKLVKSKAK